MSISQKHTKTKKSKHKYAQRKESAHDKEGELAEYVPFKEESHADPLTLESWLVKETVMTAISLDLQYWCGSSQFNTLCSETYRGS